MSKWKRPKHTCRLCSRELSNFHNHLKAFHLELNLTDREYYKRYVLKDENSGKCKTCGEDVKFYGVVNGFPEFCGTKCLTKHPDTINKRTSTYYDNKKDDIVYLERKAIRDNRKSRISKECQICNKKIKDLKKHLTHYHPKIEHDKYYLQYINPDAIKCQTCGKNENRFIGLTEGFSNFCSRSCFTTNPEIVNKRKKTLIEKFGVDSPLKVQEFRDKGYEKCRNKSEEEKLQKKLNTIESIKSKNGEGKRREDIEYFDRLTEYFKNRVGYSFEMSWDEFWELRSKQRGETAKVNRDKELYTIKCTIHDRKLLVSLRQLNNMLNGNWHLCPQCSHNGSSLAEKEVLEFVQSIYSGEILENTKRIITPKELDIYISDKNVAIEYHGLYHHSLRPENSITKNYHLEKYLACKEKGIHLIQVFEDEWRDKPDIVKSIIKNKLGITDTKLMARKLKVVSDLHKDTVMQFLNKNHISGSGGKNYQKMFGLIDDKNNLVTVLTLRKPFTKNKSGVIEIARFCSILNTQVLGGFSKLLKRTINWAKENNYNTILTYADLRFGSGDTYLKSGFILENRTAPNYFYVNGDIREGRFENRAQDGLSERDRAIELNIFQIYDCGSNRYILSV